MESTTFAADDVTANVLDFIPLANDEVRVLPTFRTSEEESLNAFMNPLTFVSASVSIACTNVPTPFALTESVALTASTRLLTASEAPDTFSGFTSVKVFE